MDTHRLHTTPASTPGVTDLVNEVVERLKRIYDFDFLGNQDDPLDELIYIVLSTRTRGVVFQRTYAELRRRFRDWEAARTARLETLERVLRPAGLSRKKASWLKATLGEIRHREGTTSLDVLGNMNNAEAENYLTSLPGIGLKTARCVLMYSLNRQVLPVDANVKRLMERLGLLSPNLHYYFVHDAAQDVVSPELRADLHVYGILHGRRVCLPRRPRCVDCVLKDICPYPAGT